MTVQSYTAFVYQAPGASPNDGWDIVFPDFPGCVSQGDTMHEALENGREALALHIEGMVAKGEKPPSPSRNNGPYADWVVPIVKQKNPIPIIALVPIEIPGKSTRINITMDEALINRLDAAASSEGTTRSGYLAQAVREKLQRNREAV